MSFGLQLFRAVIDTGARTAFRDIDIRHLLPEELPVHALIQTHFSRYGVMPSLTEIIEGGFALPTAPQPPEYYRDRIRERAIRNHLLVGLQDISQAVQSRNFEEAVAILTSTHTILTNAGASQDMLPLHVLMQDVLADMDAVQTSRQPIGVNLGWQFFDDKIGGIVGGDVVTLAGRPGMGKSYLMQHSAIRSWRAGNTVLYCTMEMSGKAMARRVLGQMTGTNPDLIRSGRVSTWARDMLHETVTSVEVGHPFHVLSGNLRKHTSDINALAAEVCPDVIYIDASYLLQPNNSGGSSRKSRWEAVTEVGEQIKEMAMSRDRPVFQSVQLNRAARKEGATNVDTLSGADAIGQLSSVVITISEAEGNNETRRRKLNMVKNREGTTGECEINFLFDPINFDYIPSAQTAPPMDEDGEWRT